VRICTPQAQEGFEWVRPVKDDDFEFVTTLAGTRHKSGWTPLSVRTISVDRGEHIKQSDFPFMGGHVLVLGDRARQVVAPLVEKDGELLPLACRGRSLWLLNVCTFVDALDLERSEVERFESGGIMDIVKHAFNADRLQGVDVLKLENDRRGPIYLGERVVSAIEAAPLIGYGFELLWTDEAGSAPRPGA